jgi:hypothetical protein
MRRLALLLPLLLLFPLTAPPAAGEDDDRLELDKLRRIERALGDAAMEYGLLADIHAARGRRDEARAARATRKRLLDQQAEVRRRIRALVSGEVEKPAPPEESGAPVDWPPSAGTARPRTSVPPFLRLRLAERSRDTEVGRAVEGGLEWLRRHQGPDGLWDCDGFFAACENGPCGGSGYSLFDPGVTGLALLAFLGDGRTHETSSEVKRGLKALRDIQDEGGCFGARTTNRFPYHHGVAAQAMIEAYALTGSAFWKTSADKAVGFIVRCQNPYLGWRYGIRPQDNDTSVTGWMTLALVEAREAGLAVPAESLDGAKAWLEKVTEPEYGRVGYTARGTGPARPHDIMDEFPPDRSEALTAEGVAMRVFLGERPGSSEMISKGTELCLKVLPQWDRDRGAIDVYHWFHGTLAMHQVGGGPWEAWRKALHTALLPNQRTEGCAAGSWDPVGVWGREGGRVYATALAVLCLEAPWRFARRFPTGLGKHGWSEPPAPPPELRGTVTLSVEGIPLGNVIQRIGTLAGVPTRFDASAEDAMAKPLTVSLKDVPVRKALDLVTKLAGVSWRLHEGKIVIHRR